MEHGSIDVSKMEVVQVQRHSFSLKMEMKTKTERRMNKFC